MTPEQIHAIATEAGVACELAGDAVRYYETFRVDAETEEPHDVSWSRYCDAQEDCASVGLKIIDFESDNDSCMGQIVEKE